MLLRDFVDLVVEKIKAYYQTEQYSAMVNKYQNQPITKEMIQGLLNTLIEFVRSDSSLEQDLVEYLENKLESYLPGAMKSVRRNSHMNNVTKVENIMCQEWSEAILVDFANHVCGQQGIDLAMYTIDLPKN